MEKNIQRNELKKRSFISVLVLFGQSGTVQIMGFFANLALTILLSPEIFGLYFTVLAIIAVLNYFSDVGLAASLIQKNNIDKKDLASSFTMQQILIISIGIIGYFLTPFVKSYYNLPDSGIILYWALLLSFFISSLKTIPSILLEREVNFAPLSIVHIVENLVFYVVVVALSYGGFSIHAFTIATLARAITGLIAVYIASPWMPAIGLYKENLKALLSYGIPFQANSLLALVKDELITLYLGKLLGFTQLGYVGWAKKWSSAPQQMIMSNFIRVSFPTFSRLKDDKKALVRVTEKFLYFMCLILFPALVGVVFVMPYFVQIIPRYTKWEPALFSLSIFCFSALLSSVSTPLTNLLNAIGKIKLSLFLMIMWTILTWGLIPTFVHYYGFDGVSLSLLTISTTSLLVVKLTQRYVPFSLIKPLTVPTLSTLVMGCALFALSLATFPPALHIVLTIMLGAFSYGIAALVFTRGNLIIQMRDLLQLLKK